MRATHIGGVDGNVCGSYRVMRGPGMMMLIHCISLKVGKEESLEIPLRSTWMKSRACPNETM